MLPVLSDTLTFAGEDQVGLNSYGWDNIRALGAHHLVHAVFNAESLAYLTLAAKLYSKGFAISKEGELTAWQADLSKLMKPPRTRLQTGRARIGGDEGNSTGGVVSR